MPRLHESKTTNCSEKIIFHTRLKKLIFHRKKKFLILIQIFRTEKLLYLLKNTGFLNEKIFCTCSTKPNFPKQKNSYTPSKNQFSKQTFLIKLIKTLKLIFYICAEELFYCCKVLHFRCVLNMTSPLFMLAKLNKVFSKLLRIIVCAGIYM